MELALAGKTVLITGASKGIGRAVAESFAAEGCHQVLAARTLSALEAAQSELRGRYNVGVAVRAIDLSQPGSAAALAGEFPDIDILVNNAGAIPGGSIDVVTEPVWREAWQLKVFGYINLCREYFALMGRRRAGVIANVIGLAATRPMFDYIAGTTGNAALVAFTRALGSKSVDQGVRVFGINPPSTATDRMITLARTRAQQQFGDPERWQDTLKSLPFGRPATPKEMADMVVFLSSPLAGYVSGVVLDVDAGIGSRN
jgi:NAD(P)-dependent dehydrogenase (short-subunit alcohol dehydrogenase family)